MDVVTLAVFPTRAEAEIASAALRAAGIPAAVRADDEGGLNPGFFRRYAVRLEVAAADRARAEEILAGP